MYCIFYSSRVSFIIFFLHSKTLWKLSSHLSCLLFHLSFISLFITFIFSCFLLKTFFILNLLLMVKYNNTENEKYWMRPYERKKKNWVVQLLPALRTLQIFFWQIIKISSEKVSQLNEQVDFKLSNTILISQYEIKVYYI